ncbi:diacylglycerol/lipid kinase family protein [Aridibaculum aurantiacum]|uniref:diacylglycerol/lipid kinase family protein n=1 Tax=Aridibaculum aurantiacum TaxID=2810307 RepID=UPI001F600BB1|nr:YegS/Rv2252/BmrU family lipid kinase [Aridibaculum aurantiacum]
MRKIIYLVNPKSGTSKKGAVQKLIELKTAAKGIHYEIFPTTSTGIYDDLVEKIEQENITDVVMVGGDGTVNQVVKALKECNINFGIIPMGSGNGLAYCAGIPRNPLRALDIIFDGTASYIDAFLINDQFSCMLSGLGFDAQVAHDFANKSARGLLTYTQQSLFQYFKAQPYQFEIVLDNFSFYTDAFLVCIANSNQFGNYVTIAPKASLKDGLLDIVVVQKMNKARLPFAVLRQIRGNNMLETLVENVSKKNVLYFQAESLTIRNLKHAPLHVDGEPRPTEEEYQVKILPKCFKLIMPAV